jgi:hypothetical protein
MDRFDSPKNGQNADPFIGTIGDDLDRLEAKTGRIGMNTAEQAFSILHKLDEIYERMQAVENEQSRRIAETQFEGVTTKINKEGSLFIRDLGGAAALRKAREQVKPPEGHWWWYLDNVLGDRRRASFRRNMIGLAMIAGALLVLGVIYQLFLAPDPAVAARYGHEQSARDLMMSGNIEAALEEVDKGLSYEAQDPTLLTQRGVLLESLGRDAEAQQAFLQAEKGFDRREDFLVTRGQAYSMVSEMEKGMADAQEAIDLDPDFAQAHLLSGQINELTQNPQQAMIDYDNAFAAAEKSKQFELAALARTRTAMLMQIINSQIDFPTEVPTP